jgi:hypothetical protein
LLRHYAEAIEAGRRSWSLNRNWPHGLRYVVAGLGQLGRIAEAQPALAALKLMDANLDSSAGILRRVYPDPTAGRPHPRGPAQGRVRIGLPPPKDETHSADRPQASTTDA